MNFKQALVGTAAFLVLGTVYWTPVHSQDSPRPAAQKRAVDRTRRQAQMLDDLYKNAIVVVTSNYVNEDSDLAAGDAFQALFKAMKDKGWHEVRLLDATGNPYDDDNSPREGFEQAAIKVLKSGAKSHEEVVTREGKRYLQYATPVPVVMEKCILCHDHYKDAKPGAPIGALSYTLPIE